MEITYKRKIEHCSVSTYVKEVTIKNLSKAANSDNLSVVEFDEIGWNAVVPNNSHYIGEKVVFIPPESVLPDQLVDILNIEKYTSKGKIRVTNFRGNRSEGLIVKKEVVSPFFDYIMKWEDPPELFMSGNAIKAVNIPIEFAVFYKMPNIMNEPYTFYVGERIYYSEKIHGTNIRFGRHVNPLTNEIQLYVGSHRIVLEENSDNIYWVAVNTFVDTTKLPLGYTFYGEVFGKYYGKIIQDLTYGRETIDMKVYAATDEFGRYVPIERVKIMCNNYNIPSIAFDLVNFESLEQLRELANQPSEVAMPFAKDHIREGIVIVAGDDPAKMAKCFSFDYLARKNKTERH